MRRVCSFQADFIVVCVIYVVGRQPDPNRLTNHATAALEIQQTLDAILWPVNCSDARLLLVDYDQDNFEGLGSTLAQVAAAVAEGYYSNRTVVIGPRPALIFGMRFRAVASANWCNSGNGFDCFFEPISRCSISDVTRFEAEALARNPYSETRVKRYDGGRANGCLLTPPAQYRNLVEAREWWTHQIAKRVFRPLPWLAARIDAARAEARLQEAKRPWIGVHVRHGDLNLTDHLGVRFYSHKVMFGFDKYWGLMEAEHPEANTVFLASDSREAFDAVMQRSGLDRDRRYIILNRLRTAYGTHNVPQDSLPYHVGPDVHAELRVGTSRLKAIDLVIEEAVVDIALLSECDFIIGTGSSYFSMWGSILRERPTSSGKSVAAPIWLDSHGLIQGEHPVAFLFSHMANRTARLDDPQKRWEIIDDWFRDIPRKPASALGVRFEAKRGFPFFDYAVFDEQLRTFRWQDPRFIIPCSGSAAEKINLGAEFWERSRFGRAVVCWESAWQELPRGSEYEDVAIGNLRTLRQKWRFYYENRHAFGQSKSGSRRGVFQQGVLSGIIPDVSSNLLNSESHRYDIPYTQLLILVCGTNDDHQGLLRLRRSSPFGLVNVCQDVRKWPGNWLKLHGMKKAISTLKDVSPNILLMVLDAFDTIFQLGIAASEVHERYHKVVQQDPWGGPVVLSTERTCFLRAPCSKREESSFRSRIGKSRLRESGIDSTYPNSGGILGPPAALHDLYSSLEFGVNSSDQDVLGRAFAKQKKRFSGDYRQEIFGSVVEVAGKFDSSLPAEAQPHCLNDLSDELGPLPHFGSMWTCLGMIGTCCLNDVRSNRRYTTDGCQISRAGNETVGPLVWHGNGRGRRVWDSITKALDASCIELGGNSSQSKVGKISATLLKRSEEETFDFLSSARSGHSLPEDCSEKGKSLTVRLNWPHGFASVWNSFVSNAALFAIWAGRRLHIELAPEWLYSCVDGANWTCWFAPSSSCSPPPRIARTVYRAEGAEEKRLSVRLQPNPSARWFSYPGSEGSKHEQVRKHGDPLFHEQHIEVDAKSLYVTRSFELVTYHSQWRQIYALLVNSTLDSAAADQLTASLFIKRRVNRLLWKFAPRVGVAVNQTIAKWSLPGPVEFPGRGLWGIMIRRGDKKHEHSLWPAKAYCSAVRKELKRRPLEDRPMSILVVGDDHAAFEDIVRVCKLKRSSTGSYLRFIDAILPNETGFITEEFQHRSRQEVETHTIWYLSQLTALSWCDVVVGSIESNSVRLIQTLRNAPLDSLIRVDNQVWDMHNFSIV